MTPRWDEGEFVFFSIASCLIESRFGVCCTARATYTGA